MKIIAKQNYTSRTKGAVFVITPDLTTVPSLGHIATRPLDGANWKIVGITAWNYEINSGFELILEYGPDLEIGDEIIW